MLAPTTLDRQTGEMAHIVRSLASGEAHVARERLTRLLAGSGPIGQAFAELATGLSRLARQDLTSAGLDVQLLDPQQQAQSISHLLGEQTRLLNATDLALRDQAAVANQLVAAIQLLAPSAGDPSSQTASDRQFAYPTMRAVEQLALDHASSTAMLGARMARLRHQQDELDARVRGRSRRSPAGAGYGRCGQPRGMVPRAERVHAGARSGSVTIGAVDVMSSLRSPRRRASRRHALRAQHRGFNRWQVWRRLVLSGVCRLPSLVS
ncbi:MAG TPA: hypothetical protein VIG30_07845 [Ktedonobacterales bacterium]